MNNTKKVIIAILLLFIELTAVAFFLNGANFSNIAVDDLLPSVILFILISAVMSIIPFVLYKVNGKRLDYKTGITVAIYNSVGMYIVAIINPIINILKGMDNVTMSISVVELSKMLIILYTITAILFVFINMLFYSSSKKVSKKK